MAGFRGFISRLYFAACYILSDASRTDMMTEKGRARLCYYIAAVITVLILIAIFYAWHQYSVKTTSETMYVAEKGRRVPDNPGNPQRYEYGNYLMARGKSRQPGCRRRSKDLMMNTAHWDTDGTYGHTSPTWGLPPYGGLQPDYSGCSKEGMMSTAHWDTDGTYGHTGPTLPAYGLSGYYEDAPTAPWA
jgi:hypothetical protein